MSSSSIFAEKQIEPLAAFVEGSACDRSCKLQQISKIHKLTVMDSAAEKETSIRQ